MNNRKIVIITAVLLITASALGYGQYKARLGPPPVAPPPVVQLLHTLCLRGNEIASVEIASGTNAIVIRDSGTQAEVYRFRLPDGNLLKSEIDSCRADVVMATALDENTLAVGGSVTRHEYSYDGREKKRATIVDNTNQKVPADIRMNRSGKYVAVYRNDERQNDGGYHIQVVDMGTGMKVYDKTGFNIVWHMYWSYPIIGPDKGEELLRIELQSPGDLVVINTKTWAASSSPGL